MKEGLTLRDLKTKLNDISDHVKEDTDLYITFKGWDTAYVVDGIGVCGYELKSPDGYDRVTGCPLGIEFVSKDHVEQTDIYTEVMELSHDDQFDLIMFLFGRDEGLLEKVMEVYG